MSTPSPDIEESILKKAELEVVEKEKSKIDVEPALSTNVKSAGPIEIEPFTNVERIPAHWNIFPTSDPEINLFSCTSGRILECSTEEFNYLMKV